MNTLTNILVRLSRCCGLAAMLLGPAWTFALEVGEIQVQSALNQLLDATIPLPTLTPESSERVSVKLAGPETFKEFGLEPSPALKHLVFSIQYDAEERVYVKVVSTQPIREPSLGLLLEFSWPRGKMFREFTLLLDPIRRLAQRPGGRSRTVLNTPEHASVGPTPASAENARPLPVSDKASPSVALSSPVKTVQSSSSPYQPGGSYGPVAPGEGLWGIALKVRPEGISREQMMQALFLANPQAFSSAGIDGLKSGVMLRIPTYQEIADFTGSTIARRLAALERGGETLSPDSSKPTAPSPAEARPKVSPLSPSAPAETLHAPVLEPEQLATAVSPQPENRRGTGGESLSPSPEGESPIAPSSGHLSASSSAVSVLPVADPSPPPELTPTVPLQSESSQPVTASPLPSLKEKGPRNGPHLGPVSTITPWLAEVVAELQANPFLGLIPTLAPEPTAIPVLEVAAVPVSEPSHLPLSLQSIPAASLSPIGPILLPLLKEIPSLEEPLPSPRAYRGGKYYGPVGNSERLWDIAAKVRPDPRISLDVMMKALLAINPHAFSKPNIDYLKIGVLLRVPTLQEIVDTTGSSLVRSLMEKEKSARTRPFSAP